MSHTEKYRVAAIVVTYNRKELLRECLLALLSQTRPLDEIIVIDNASTDGTDQLIKEKFAGITYVKLAENIGGSGGFHEGMKIAYEKGYDWIWIMDDDATPNNDCLENMCTALRLLNSGKVCIYACHLDHAEKHFTEPICVYESCGQLLKVEKYDEALKRGRLLQARGGPFLGVLIPARAVIEVGLPRKDTFIWGDNEYFQRLREYGFKIYYDTKSILHHPKHDFGTVKLPLNVFRFKKPIWVTISWPKGPPWKHYYGIRNSTYFGIHNTENVIICQYLKTMIGGVFRTYIAVKVSPEKFKTLKYCLLGIIDGFVGRMDRRIRPL